MSLHTSWRGELKRSGCVWRWAQPVLRFRFASFGLRNSRSNRPGIRNVCGAATDVMPIYIGDGTQIGPGVQIYAADHPRDPVTRLLGKEKGRTTTIGKNVWIGGGAILLPGVTIADEVTIGAGAIVTGDVARKAESGWPSRANNQTEADKQRLRRGQ
jgi:acetyltransferase-like isoleucine patch superfamily enzyme